MIPVLPLRDVVVYPHMVIPLFVGRDRSIQALQRSMERDKQILLVAQVDAGQDNPAADEIYRIGTVSTILQLLKLPDGTVKVLVEGGQRARVEQFDDGESFLAADVTPLESGPVGRARDRGADAIPARSLRAVRQAQQEDPAGDPRVAVRYRERGPPRGYRRRPSRREDRAQAGHPRDSRHARAPGASRRARRGGDRSPAGREAYSRPREAADGEEPARVLPQRAR